MCEPTGKQFYKLIKHSLSRVSNSNARDLSNYPVINVRTLESNQGLHQALIVYFTALIVIIGFRPGTTQDEVKQIVKFMNGPVMKRLLDDNLGPYDKTALRSKAFEEIERAGDILA